MMAQSSPATPQPTPAAASQSSTIGPSDPIWRHVKSAWDHQFVQRSNFIPWLRGQLEIDPIDERVPNPEPLVSYIKRRLALIQAHNQAQTIQSSTTTPPLTRSGDATTPVASMAGSHGDHSTISPNLQPNVSPYTPTSTSQSTVSLANNMLVNGNALSTTLAHNVAAKEPLQAPPKAAGYSSQLGAIADAHMGTSSTATPATQSFNSLFDKHQPPSGHGDRVQQSMAFPLNPTGTFNYQQRTQAENHSQQNTPIVQMQPHPLPMYSSLQTTNYPQQQLTTPSINGLFTCTPNLSTTQDSYRQSLRSDPMSRIHPNLINNAPTLVSVVEPHIQPDLEMALPSIPPAIANSFTMHASATGRNSPMSNPESIDQPRTTRSNAAAKKNTNRVETTTKSDSTPSGRSSLPNAINGGSKDKPKSSVQADHSVVAPKVADQYDRKAWKSRLSTLRAELDHISRTPTRTANKLIKILSVYSITPTPQSGDWSTVPPEGRLEVLTAIKNSANKDFYNAWAIDSKGVGIIESWLKGSVHAHEKAKPKLPDGGSSNDKDPEFQDRDAVLVSILQMVEKLPITVEHLKSHTFAKQVMRINKEINSQKFSNSVKNMSTKLETEWRAAVRDASGVKTANSDASSSRDTKKRNEPSPEPAQVKKRKVENTIKPGSLNSATKAAEPLFGKPKLPAFAKKKAEPVTPQLTNVTMNPFAEAMAALKEKNANNGLGEVNMSFSDVSKPKTHGKPKKRVTFASDEKLCQIKIVERLVYEGEENDNEAHPLLDARKMDAIEGHYLHHGTEFLEEEMEWVTPSEVVLTPETISNLETSPLDSPEALIQEEREKTVVEATYYNESQIPESPHEPPEGERGNDQANGDMPKMMKLGGELLTDPEVPRWIARAHADNTAPDAPVAHDDTVSDILARLNGANQPSMVPAGQTTLPPAIDLDLLQSLSQQGSLQAFLAASTQASAPSTAAPVAAPQGPNAFRRSDNGWGAAAGSARMTSQREPVIPTGPSSGSGGGKKKGRKHRSKEFSNRKLSAYDPHGRHIACKWWPNCPHGTKCFYRHGD